MIREGSVKISSDTPLGKGGFLGVTHQRMEEAGVIGYFFVDKDCPEHGVWQGDIFALHEVPGPMDFMGSRLVLRVDGLNIDPPQGGQTGRVMGFIDESSMVDQEVCHVPPRSARHIVLSHDRKGSIRSVMPLGFTGPRCMWIEGHRVQMAVKCSPFAIAWCSKRTLTYVPKPPPPPLVEVLEVDEIDQEIGLEDKSVPRLVDAVVIDGADSNCYRTMGEAVVALAVHPLKYRVVYCSYVSGSREHFNDGQVHRLSRRWYSRLGGDHLYLLLWRGDGQGLVYLYPGCRHVVRVRHQYHLDPGIWRDIRQRTNEVYSCGYLGDGSAQAGVERPVG